MFDDEAEEGNSRDSGYDSQNHVDDFMTKRRRDSPSPEKMEDILKNCSPDKEEGFAPIKSSPERDDKIIHTDGFDFDSLETISEDQENESPKFDLNSLLSNKIILPDHLDGNKAFTNPSTSDDPKPEAEPIVRKISLGMQKRPTYRRALSMFEKPTGSEFDSPVSRNSEFSIVSGLSRFKRPEPPRDEEQDNSSKRRRFNCSSLMSDQSFAGSEERRNKPKFYRSHSENELSVMKSCQLKEEIDDILPDSSR